MKKAIISGAIVIALGLLIALGPQFLFKVCSSHGGAFPLCHWSAQAELGMGMLIAALGICLIVFTDQKTQFGLYIGIFFSVIIALSIPNALIGGCNVKTMACRRVAFPAITIISVIVLVFSAVMAVCIDMKKPPVEKVSYEMQGD
jgi:hypothetical protein